MKKDNRPLFLDGDDVRTRKQIELLLERKYDVRRPTQFQIKVGPVNFFPTTGKVTTDPHLKHPQKGFDYFLEVLESLTSMRYAIEEIKVNFDDN
jgi:hypothetical protein